MKRVLSAILILIALNASAEPSKFFEPEPAPASGRDPFWTWVPSEMSRAQFADFVKLRSLDPWVPLADGTRLEMEKITLITASGVRCISDQGIAVIPWERVETNFKHYMGWSTQAQIVYERWKKGNDQWNNSKVYKARMKAIEAENRASADAGEVEKNSQMAVSKEVVALGWPADPVGLIRSEAALRWPGNYSMQEFVIKEELEDLGKMRSYITTGIPGVPAGVAKGIISDAVTRWPKRFGMMVFVIEDQAKSWKKLNGVAD